MSENENKVCPVSCKIEHHAMMFAFLAKHAIELCGEAGKDAILAGMTTYGNERGARMAANALAHGDELTTMTNQAYGEWKPDYTGQMDFGTLRTEPTLQTYIAKCAWCEAWKKHNITEYGKYYCVNVDNAVYQGFRSDFRGANAGNFIRITGFDGYVVREHVSQITFAAAGRAIQADGEKRPVGPVFDIGKGFGVAGGDHEVLLAEKRLVFESQRQLSDVGVFVHLLSVSFCSKRQKPFWSGRRG